jgi:hypothetical protein
MPLDSGHQPPPHIVMSLYPSVTTPHGKQELSCVLFFPSEIGVAHSCILPETEALKNFTCRRPFLLHGIISPSLLHRIKGVESLIIHCCIHSPSSFESLTQELALTEAQVTATTIPHHLAASVALPPRAMGGEVPKEPLFLPKHPRRALVHHSHYTLELW